MRFVEMFSRDNYPEGQDFWVFEFQTVIPKQKEELATNWARMYKLFGVSFKEVPNGFEFEAHGDCPEGREDLVNELLEDLCSIVDGKERVRYFIEDSKRPAYSWEGEFFPKGGHFEYSKGGVEYRL